MSRLFRHMRARPVLTLLWAFGLTVAGWIAWQLFSPAHDPLIAQLRQKGLPVTLAELNGFYPAVDPGKNVALTYQKCFESALFLNPNWKDQSSKKWLPTRGKELDEECSREIRELLHSNAPVFQILHTATGPARYPIDLRAGPLTLLPHLAKVKYGVFLLSSESLLRAQEKEPQASVDALLAAQRLADSLAEEPLVISCLVRYANLSVVLRRLERVMSLVQLNEEQLARLEALLAALETNSNLSRGLAGEVAIGLGCFGDWQSQRGLITGQSGTQASLSEKLQVASMLSLLKVSGYLAKDRQFFLESMSSRIAANALPFPQKYLAGSAASTNLPANQFYFFSRKLLPSLSNLFEREARYIALLRTARVAIAIERFQLTRASRLPERLEDLVPDYLSALPLDPFNGETLQYKRSPSGYTVYSVDSDLKDDGGAELEVGTASGPCDVIFSVKRSEE